MPLPTTTRSGSASRAFRSRAKTISLDFIRCMVLALMIHSLPYCDSRRGEVDREKERIQLLWLFPSPVDAMAACSSTETQALSCVQKAGLPAAAYAQMISAAFSVTINGTDSSAICRALLKAPAYSHHSQAALDCQFQCEGRYWETAQTNGTCTASALSGVVSALANGTDTNLKACLNQCFLTGTVLP